MSWERSWLLWDNNKVVGHILLRTMSLASASASASHRADLQMGFELNFRGKGYGSELLKTAIDWAKESSNLEWIDLAGFDNNIPALKLCKLLGFEETGHVRDMFRVSGTSLNNVAMSLKL